MRSKLEKRARKIWSGLVVSFSLILLLMLAPSAMAQTNTFPSSGSAGIGTTSPSSNLHVKSTDVNNPARVTIENTSSTNYSGADIKLLSAQARASGVYATNIPDASTWFFGTMYGASDKFGIGRVGAYNDDSAASYVQAKFVVDSSGNVGIGTTSPAQTLNLSKASGSNYVEVDSGTNGGYFGTDGTNLVIKPRNSQDVTFYNTAGSTRNVTIQNGGNVGIGTTTPSTKLHVVGDVTVTGNIAAKYQDVAEWVPASERIPSGTVVVLDPSKINQVMPSAQAYDTRVAGVVSQQPGIALGDRGEGKVLVATTGRVRVKVDASKVPIHIGDLLVTSDVPGVAMKSQPINIGGVQLHRPGTLIGKALEPLAKGSGEILVLLSLQ